MPLSLQHIYFRMFWNLSSLVVLLSGHFFPTPTEQLSPNGCKMKWTGHSRESPAF